MLDRAPVAAALATAIAAAALSALLLLRRRGLHRRLLQGVLLPRGFRIAYLNAEDAPKWADQLDLFAAALDLPTACFRRFDVYNGEYPTAAQFESGEFSAVLVTGSHHSAVDRSLPWLEGLFECLRAAAAVPDVSVLGCCFGAQACAVALGGTVGGNPDGRFVFGCERVALDTPRLAGYAWASAALGGVGGPPGAPPSLPSSLWLLESHGEQVLRLPPDAELLGFSGSTPHEVAARHTRPARLPTMGEPGCTALTDSCRVRPPSRADSSSCAASFRTCSAARRTPSSTRGSCASASSPRCAARAGSRRRSSRSAPARWPTASSSRATRAARSTAASCCAGAAAKRGWSSR